MLPAANRLVAGHDFAATIRRGQRAGTPTVVLHLAVPASDDAGPPRVGMVVSKAVGPAVTRNLVKRRLRHLARERLRSLPGAAVLVVRALPPAATASYAELGADVDRALARVLDRAGARA